uniref:Uncharacterized protein n=1 Tax=Triticum urartu TaxID=4572 RepID=A0A8R7QCF3_TRIUA
EQQRIRGTNIEGESGSGEHIPNHFPLGFFLRSPNPRVQMSESGSGEDMTHRRRRRLPGDGDLLWEILLRLPPQPSSLRRLQAMAAPRHRPQIPPPLP